MVGYEEHGGGELNPFVQADPLVLEIHRLQNQLKGTLTLVLRCRQAICVNVFSIQVSIFPQADLTYVVTCFFSLCQV